MMGRNALFCTRQAIYTNHSSAPNSRVDFNCFMLVSIEARAETLPPSSDSHRSPRYPSERASGVIGALKHVMGC